MRSLNAVKTPEEVIKFLPQLREENLQHLLHPGLLRCEGPRGPV